MVSELFVKIVPARKNAKTFVVSAFSAYKNFFKKYLTRLFFNGIMNAYQGDESMNRNMSKRYDNLAGWDLDAKSRKYVNNSTPARRKLKRKLRRQARKTFAQAERKLRSDDDLV